MARRVHDVHRGHVLIQEVAPDGDGVAAAAVVLFDGDAGRVAGTRGTETATSAGGQNVGLRKRGARKRLGLERSAYR